MRNSCLLFAVTALAGCTLGPDFRPPAAPPVNRYQPEIERQKPAAGEPLADMGSAVTRRWWESFKSTELDILVDRAIAGNPGLEAANARLAAARSEVRAIAGKRLPQIDATARVEQEQVNLAAFGFTPFPAPGVSGNPEFHLYSVGGGISYDLDVFGGLRRQLEQTAARAESQQRQTEAAHLALAGQVVGQVLTIAAIRARIDTAETILKDDRRNLELSQKRQRGGEGTLVEVLNAQSQYTTDRGILPPLEQNLAEARHLLATLLGIPPSELGSTDFELDGFTLPTRIPISLPSELVRNRPDILQAEADLHVSMAAIGVATARLYPNITIGATGMQGSPGIDDLLKNVFRGYDIFAGLTSPIFHGGTLKAQRDAAVERARAADATYRETILQALAQVADLLSALQTDARAVAMQHDAVDVAGRSAHLSRRSFEVGNSGVLQVLDTERLYQRATADLVNARARQYLNVARLYVAIGGGWLEPSAASAPSGNR